MHKCKHGLSTPATNADFWRSKREINRKRDRRNIEALRRAGWRVSVVWECELGTNKIARVIERLQKLLSVGTRRMN
jgi:DNA mismatch endonuclease, patch repair protein